MKIHGTFTSYWENGSELQSSAELDSETGKITVHNAFSGEERGNLDSEKFEDEEGNEYDICPCCHEYILKTVMVQDKLFKSVVNEEPQCANKECEYNS